MLTVYGATGYTGRLVVELLASRGVALTIAGRSAEKLHALRDRIADHAPDIAVVGLEDRAGLYALAKRSRVILSCAGPFSVMGPPVIDACLRAGAHYLDVTGEVRFMAATALRDREAKDARVALVNAVGFDVVPSDLCAFLAARGLKEGAPPDELEIALALGGGRPSAGTLRTLVEIAAAPSLYYDGGRFLEEKIAARSRRFEFPELGESEAFNAPIGDVATAPRTTGAKRVRAYARLPARARRMLTLALPPARVFLSSPLGTFAKRALPKPGEGPSESERQKARFSIVAEARRGDEVSRASISGRDGYGLTAECAAAIALAMNDPGYDKSGALSPMTAYPPEEWRALLEKFGCTITAPA